MAKIAIVYYSLYGHCRKLAEYAANGVKEQGGEAKIYQVPETLSEEIRTKMHAPPHADDPIITPDELTQHDGYIFVIPTRYGRAVSQFSAFFDATGGLWMKQALSKKMGTIITSTATQSGGQETTALTTLPWFAHQGVIYVPLGYSQPEIMTLSEVIGGSPWGAGTLAGGDGSRQPSEQEQKVTLGHGKYFTSVVNQFVKGA